jgi:hypothetical protein
MTTPSEVLVARRYLDRGFLDTAMDLLVRHAPTVDRHDWLRLADALMDRLRIADVVRICALGDIPLPRERILSLGDARLRRRDLDGAKALYELADADVARWQRLVDVLTAMPGRARLAISIAERHLAGVGDGARALG